MKKYKTIINIFIIWFLFVTLINVITPDKEFSNNENRYLTQMPVFSWNNIKSGRFAERFEQYYTDQFFLRDMWVSVKSKVERLIMKKENNGIFFGQDGFLLENYKQPDWLDRNINALNFFAENSKEVDINFLLVPNSVKIYEDKLPNYANPYNQLKVIDNVKNRLNQNINFINVYDSLKSKKDEEIYFKTDHHWTMLGAYYGYEAYMKSVNMNAQPIDNFDRNILAYNFFGSYYSKANNYELKPDILNVFYLKNRVPYKVHYWGMEEPKDSIYNYEYLEKKDKYSVFFGGNHPIINIKTQLDNDKKILVIKDSYANAFIPFLINHYEQIDMLDLRFFNQNIYDYINDNNIDEVLFLYNVSTFGEDENIRNITFK